MRYLCLLLAFVTILSSQSVITVQVDTFSRPMPLIGFNTNAHHSIANWKIKDFRDSTALLQSAILRYPGGTTANHWDWKKGWFQSGPTTPPQFANINPKDTVRAEEFKLGVDDSQSEALFVTNFQYSTLDYELEGLMHAESLGFSMKYIEIGNEHNLAISNQFIPPEVYSHGAKIWADTLKAHFPQSKICLVGGSPPATIGWHDSIFAQNSNIDALAFHVYLGAGNSDSVMNTQRALSIPFAQLDQRFVQSKFPLIPPNVEVWVTEFNMGELLAGEPEQHAETWTHGLYVAAMIHIFLENLKITMIINNNLTNQLSFAAISPFDYHITANGVIMQLFGEVSKGMKTATRLSFPTLPTQQYGATSYPKLIGWKFDDGAENRGIIINLSSDTIECDLQTVFGNSALATQYFSDSIAMISGKSGLDISQTATSSQIKIKPYSVVQLTPMTPASVSRQTDQPSTFRLDQNFPNPFNPSTSIAFELPKDGFVSLKIYDAIGREISSLVHEYKNSGHYSITFDASDVVSGLYFYQLRSEEYVETKKMLLIK